MMKNRLKLASIVAVCMTCLPAQGQPQAPLVSSNREIHQRALQLAPYVVRIESHCNNESDRASSGGFGIIVGSRGEDLFIAAPYHVVWGNTGVDNCILESNVYVGFKPIDEGYMATSLGERMRGFGTELADLAIVAVRGGRRLAPPAPAAVLARDRIEEGISVVVFGALDGWTPSQLGLLIQASPNREELLFQGLPAIEGTSGAAIVTENAIVGMMRAGAEDSIEEMALPAWKIVELFNSWNLPTNHLVVRHSSVIQSEQVNSELFSYTGSQRGPVEQWQLHALLKGHKYEINSAVFSPDGRRIVTASVDGEARVWDAATGAALLMLKIDGTSREIKSAVFSPDGRRIVTSSSDGTGRLWDAGTGKLFVTLNGHRNAVTSASFSPDGHRIVTASEDNTARLWDADSGVEIATLKGHTYYVGQAVFSPDGSRIITRSDIAVGTVDKKGVRIWEGVRGNAVATLSGHTDTILSFTVSPDGRRIVTTSSDKTARTWDLTNGRALVTFRGHTEAVETAAFSPDGRVLVTVSDDLTCRIWDASSGAALATLKGHADSIESVNFSPDGRRILTASADKTWRVWDAKTGRALAILKGHADWITSATLSPDGRRYVTASEDNTAKVWDTATGDLVGTLKGHSASVKSVRWSPNNRSILTVSNDETARLWQEK